MDTCVHPRASVDTWASSAEQAHGAETSAAPAAGRACHRADLEQGKSG
jgi:hypothetical protein